MQDFRKLMVWQRANKLAPRIRQMTETFPTGYRSMKNQIHKSVESIPFNIAEGCGAKTSKEFGRFLDIAIKSATELEAQLLLAIEYEIVAQPFAANLADENEQIRRMMTALRKRLDA